MRELFITSNGYFDDFVNNVAKWIIANPEKSMGLDFTYIKDERGTRVGTISLLAGDCSFERYHAREIELGIKFNFEQKDDYRMERTCFGANFEINNNIYYLTL